MGRANYIRNPRFKTNATDGWDAGLKMRNEWGTDFIAYTGGDASVARVTTAPKQLPSGANAAARIRITGTSEDPRIIFWMSDAITYGPGVLGCAAKCLITRPYAIAPDPFGNFAIGILPFDADGDLISGSSVGIIGAVNRWLDVGEVTGSMPSETDHVRFAVSYQGTAAADLYITQAIIDEWANAEVRIPYADGDSAGWAWDGAAHNSVSRQTRYVPQGRRPFGSGFNLRVASPGGRGVDLSGSCESFSCSNDQEGGFDTATWEHKVDPRRYIEELAPLGDVIATYDGTTVFEGRITDVGKEVRGEAGGVRSVTARGYFDALKDDESFRRCYIDKDLSRWEDLQSSNRGGFDVMVGQEDFAGISVIESQKYEQNASARLVYRLLDGDPVTGESLSYFGLVIVDTITSSDWKLRLYSRPSPSASSLALLWTSTDPGTHTLAFSAGDLDPDATGTARCIVLQMIHTGSGSFSFIGYDPDNMPGAKVTGFTAKAAGISTLSIENVIADMVSPVTTAAQRSFPDATGMVVRQLVFDEPTTRLDAIRQVNEIVTWQWGFKPGGVFEYRKPWNPATVPDRSHYDLLWQSVAPSLSFDFGECYNRCVVRYVDRRGNPRSYTATATAAALGTLTRTKVIQAPGGVYDATDAQTVADAFLSEHGRPVASGRILLQGRVRLMDGRTRHCCHMLPGEYITLRDAPSEEERTMRITRVEISPYEQSATIEVGRKPARLDRLLARMDARAKWPKRR